MAKHLIYIAIALLFSTSTSAAPLSYPIRVGAWEGNAYSHDSTGTFSHCAASTPYQSGIVFFVSVNAAWGWSLGFTHPSWSLREGETLPITLTFDKRNEFRVIGTATGIGNLTFVQVPMPDDSRLINSFRRAYVMEAFARGNRYGFNLTNTAQLLPALANCVAVNLRGPGVSQPGCVQRLFEL